MNLSGNKLLQTSFNVHGRDNQSFPISFVSKKWLYLANTFSTPALRGLPLSSQNQKQIQITIWWWDEQTCLPARADAAFYCCLASRGCGQGGQKIFQVELFKYVKRKSLVPIYSRLADWVNRSAMFSIFTQPISLTKYTSPKSTTKGTLHTKINLAWTWIFRGMEPDFSRDGVYGLYPYPKTSLFS